MSISTPATALSFAGQVDLEGRPVNVAVTVADGVVTLLVGEDSIGSWAYGEIEFVENIDGTYSVRADGDSLVFRPAEPAGFEDFLASRSPSPYVPSDEINGSNQVDQVGEVEFQLPARPETASAAPPSLNEHSQGIDPEPLSIQDPEGSMDWEPETDEYFAAGFNGPPPVDGASAPKMHFNRLPVAPGPPLAPSPEISSGPDPTDAQTETVEDTSPTILPPDGGETQTTATPVTETDLGVLSAPRPAETPADPEPDEAVPKESMLQRRRSRMETAKADRAGSPSTGDGPASVTDRLDAARPMDDRENIRQWALIIGGAIVGLTLLGVVGWVILAAMGGGDEDSPDAAPATTITVATTLPPPTPTAAVEADPEAAADAAEFIAEWNALASTYAYHMAISAEEVLPIETAVTPAIRVTYGTDRTVTINALPQGEGGDRDILVAMGMVVAWAEPQLSPAGRGDVLGSLGIDIEDPHLESVGGALTRSGVVYEASVLDRVLRFTARR